MSGYLDCFEFLIAMIVCISVTTELDDKGNLGDFLGHLGIRIQQKLLADQVYSNITVKILSKQSGCNKIF